MYKKWLCAATLVALWVVLTGQLLAQSNVATAVIARFTGTWKEDVSKRKIGDIIPLRFQKNAKGDLEELRGAEANPIVQPVVFDGTPRDTGSGNTIVWKQVDPNTFERVLSKGGETLATRRIRITADGKALTEVTERKTSDGRTEVTTIEYQRESGDAQGLFGRWKGLSVKDNNAETVTYEPAGKNGLTLKSSFPGGSNFTVILDGTRAPVVGPTTIRGIEVAAKAVDNDTIEFTFSREGVNNAKAFWKVSPDGKTLTATTSAIASQNPSVSVYVKQ